MTEKVAMTETLEKIEALTFNSRERKKSKYLSYPYINLGPGHKGFPAKTEDSLTPSHSHEVEGSNVATNHLIGSPSTAKSGKKRFRNNWCKKFIQWSTMSSSPEFINASSVELLSGLYSKAVSCNFPNENRQIDLVEWFFHTYRLSTFHDDNELAAPLANLEGGNLGIPVRNGSLNVNSEQEKRKKKKVKHAPRHKAKSLSCQSDMNEGLATREFLSNCSTEINATWPGGNVKEITPPHQLQNVGLTTFEGSRTKCNSVSEGSQVHNCSTSEGAAGPKKEKEVVASLGNPSSKILLKSLDMGEKRDKCSSFIIDLQMLSSPTNGSLDKTNGENKEELDLIGSNLELYASQPDLVGNVANHSFLVGTTLGVNVASVTKTMHRRQRRNKKAPVDQLKTKLATVIPDLNSSGIEYNSTQKELEGVKGFSPQLKSKHNQMRNQEPKPELSRSISSGMGLTQTINYSGMEANGDAQGTCLLLQFDPGVSLPSKEDLLATFCQFGPLNVCGTQMLKDGHAQIVFARSVDAEEAFHNIEQNKPFGATLIDCKLRHPTIAPTEQCSTTTGPSGSKSLHCERPSLDFIRQNLLMMESTLEKSGDNILPQMRDKLEREIKHLLKKVNSMAAGSFSM